MHEYMTRRMIAMREMTYAEWPLRPGDEFRATPIDADYLTRHGRAKPAPDRVLPVFEPAAPAVAAPAVADVPPIADDSHQTEPHPAPDAKTAEEAPRPRRTYTRRNTSQG